MNKELTYRVKIDNEVIDTLLEERMKRALFIYIFLLKNGKGHATTTLNFAMIARRLKISTATNNIKTIKRAFNYLINNDLIEVYEDIEVSSKLDNVDNIKTNTLIDVRAHESESEAFFTLIEFEAIDKVYYQGSDESREDMISLLALLCRQIERREDVLEVAWFSYNKTVSLMGIDTNRYRPLIDEMKSLKVIYFDRAEIGSKSHFIYGMHENSEQVKQAVKTAEQNRRLDVRVKLNTNKVNAVVDIEIDEETGEIHYLPQTHQLHKILEDVNFEINEFTTSLLNDLAETKTEDEIVKTIEMLAGAKIEGTDKYTNIIPLHNPTGYLVNGLKRHLIAQ